MSDKAFLSIVAVSYVALSLICIDLMTENVYLTLKNNSLQLESAVADIMRCRPSE